MNLGADNDTRAFRTCSCSAHRVIGAGSRPAGEIIRPAVLVVSILVYDDRIYLKGDAHPHSSDIHQK